MAAAQLQQLCPTAVFSCVIGPIFLTCLHAEQQAGVDTLSELPQSRRGTADIQSGRLTDDGGRRLPPRRASSLRVRALRLAGQEVW